MKNLNLNENKKYLGLNELKYYNYYYYKQKLIEVKKALHKSSKNEHKMKSILLNS